jgi:hypothetical protein
MCQNDDHALNVGTTMNVELKQNPAIASMSSFEAVSEPSDSRRQLTWIITIHGERRSCSFIKLRPLKFGKPHGWSSRLPHLNRAGPASCGGFVFLVRATDDDLRRIIRQRAL